VKYAGARFFTIVGDDAAAHIVTWERVNEVVAMSSLVVIDRPAVDERRGFATKLVYPSVTGQHST
jgi:nicotinic acid mononucleotide adenylyltransferase